MKTMIVYSSKTGNTKKVAEAILEVMPEGTFIHSVSEQPALEDCDLVILGCWIDKGNADAAMKEYIQGVKDKKVALFATLGAYPDSPHAGKVIERLKQLVDASNEYLGDFICQGKIDPALTERVRQYPPDHPHYMTPERINRHMEAAKHPDSRDLETAQKVFMEVLRRAEGI
ncbi:flavodoxin [Oxobacter pfennigii]|uniref:Flavodoxin n=1 Tax=Oxobacter pfennigii TaxID=36849 RepID=A0A0N8NTC2_9CLOT|nr:flavodoxin family protein [Oxobacter pfennigii]KPU44424.1 flavodoxin [Oxobacter pfennigii]